MFNSSFIQKTKLISAVILGNTIAWADFSLYGFLAPVLSQVFFPFTDSATAYILYFIIFAVSFLFRPLGAAVLGSFADKYGRKNTLLIAVVVSGLATFLIGCLPSYNTIGFISPFLLTILRIIQTVSVSSEPTNSNALLMESLPIKYRGFTSSFVMLGAFLGLLLGIVYLLMISYTLDFQALMSWGWRIPFLSSFFISIIVVLNLLGIDESPVFLKEKALGRILKNPLVFSVKKSFRSILIGFGYGTLMAASNYFLIGFFPTYLNKILKIDFARTNFYITVGIAIAVVFMPLWGLISDKIGRKPVLALGAILFTLFSYPIFYMISTTDPFMVLAAISLYGFFTSIVCAPLIVATAELFPPKIRCSGSGLGYNIALMLCGGTAPIIAGYLTLHTRYVYNSAWFLIVLGAINLAVILLNKEPMKVFSYEEANRAEV